MVNLKNFNKEGIGNLLIPEKIYNFTYRKDLQALHEKIYFDNLNVILFANFFFLSIIITLVLFFLSYGYIYIWFSDYFYNIISKTFIIFFTWFVINLFSYYFIIFAYYFMHDSKFRKAELEIEEDLPEFIDNLVSNLKGGISLEKALLKSVRTEQKALLSEVTLINQRIMMGDDVFHALRTFRQRFDSQVINRTFFLIEEGIKGGGNIANPLERISENLKRIYNLNNEIKASSGGFSVVIRAITLFVAPLLFALALTLLTFIGNLFSLILKSGTDTLPVSELPPEFTVYLIYFSYAMIIMITFFSSLITSELKNEKIHNAIKYLPFFMMVGIFIFKIFSKVLLGFFGNII